VEVDVVVLKEGLHVRHSVGVHHHVCPPDCEGYTSKKKHISVEKKSTESELTIHKNNSLGHWGMKEQFLNFIYDLAVVHMKYNNLEKDIKQF